MSIAIITGASSGMGRDFARLLSYEEIDELWLIARREERLVRLSKKLGIPCRTLPLDLYDRASVALLSDYLALEAPEVVWLVNAAGYGMIGKVQELSHDEQDRMVALNCSALTAITRAVLPYMAKGGRIVQFASAAAFLPQPEFAVYAATKAYVLSFSRALNAELRPRGISVTAVCPGPVNTEFLQIAEEHEAMARYKRFFMAESRRVVRSAYAGAKRRREVVVPSFPMQVFCLATKVVPHGVMLKFMK